ncbi:MurT ligase domain-containing protein [Candidatus Saccharibacteria bacterium]|nr:MurT ligase domain-containing protein [Candidatus Saccharibacteria bacterium]
MVKSPFLVSLIGKVVAKSSRLRGGHGSALPGLVAERIAPNFLKDSLSKLPRGVVVISGTNGKTTTTKMTVELLQTAGLKVLTNPSGSNFTRGVTSSIIMAMRRGKLDADIAVVELDEAHAVHFVNQIAPRYALFLNVLQDQTERFGGIDKTAKLLEKVATKVTDGVILNRDNPIAEIAGSIKVPIKFFGHDPKLDDQLPSDNEMLSGGHKNNQPVDVELVSLSKNKAEYRIDGRIYEASLQLSGVHNIINAAAALALTRMILGKKANNKTLVAALSKVKPAFGRGEIIKIGGYNLDLILIKNPSSFRSALSSQHNPEVDAIMIAINNAAADGRDVSWLKDVNFATLNHVKVVSGAKASDMAKRLRSDGVKVGTVESDIKKALTQFLQESGDKQIFCNYTAMLEIRGLLEKLA